MISCRAILLSKFRDKSQSDQVYTNANHSCHYVVVKDGLSLFQFHNKISLLVGDDQTVKLFVKAYCNFRCNVNAKVMQCTVTMAKLIESLQIHPPETVRALEIHCLILCLPKRPVITSNVLDLHSGNQV